MEFLLMREKMIMDEIWDFSFTGDVCPQFPLDLSEERILRISRTIADIFGSKELKREHIFEAIGYRALDRRS